MSEDNSHHHEFEDPSGLKPQELAAMRWQAIEAFNCAPGLSPMARRVGCALISAMDAKTRNCYPSELRIASQLGVNLTSVKNAKAELGPPNPKSLGKGKGYETVGLELISWFHPKGPRHLCHYSFNWQKLLRLCEEAKKRADEAMKERRQERSQGSLQATHRQQSNGSPTATMEKRNDASNGSRFDSQGSHLDRQGSLQATAKVAVGLPELSHELPKGTAQHITPSPGDGGLGYADDLEKPFVSQSVTQEAEPRRALEGRKKEPPKPLCFFPALVEVLGKTDAKVTAAVCRLGWDQQKEASLLLATKGNEAALAYIREHDPKGMAA
jgi:hypothetical protein